MELGTTGRGPATDRGDGAGRGFDRPLLWATLLAFGVRALWLLRPSTDTGDSTEYGRLAFWLVTRHIFSEDGRAASSYRPPLYPAVIAAGDLLTHHPIAAVLVLQVMVGTITVALTYCIARALFGKTTAWLSGFLLALAPMTSRFSTVLLTETIFTCLVVLGMWTWIRSKTVVSGVALGLATLTRAFSLPYLIALLAYGVAGPRGASRKSALTVAIVGLLTVAPWALRNMEQVRRLTVADAGWGLNLFYGTIDLHRGSNRWSQLVAAHARLDGATSAPRSEPQAAAPSYAGEQRAREVAVSWIRQHPVAWVGIRARQWPWLVLDTGDYLPVAANRTSFSGALAARQVSTIALKTLFIGGNALLLLLAAYGAMSLRGRLQETIPLWTFPVYVMTAHLPVYVEPRYGLPLVPFLVVLAAEGVRRLGVAIVSPGLIPDREWHGPTL